MMVAGLPIAENKKQARIYPGGDRGSRGMRSYYANSRAYIFLKNEPILENLVNRRRRPIAAYRSVLLALYPELEGKIRWSQRAGCSCGCSPGFIIDSTVRTAEGKPADIFITVGTAKPAEPEVDISYVEMALS